MMLPRLLVIGTGGFAKEVAQLAATINKAEPRWRIIEYIGQVGSDLTKSMPFGKVTGTDEVLDGLTEPTEAVIGIGSPHLRRQVFAQFSSHTLLRFPNLIHPGAWLDPLAVQLGQGNIITCGSVFTCDITVGNHNVFNLNCTVGHDCRIGSFNVFNPGVNISGGVALGDECLIGTGARILENLSVTSGTVLGANALLTRSTSHFGTYIGTPAQLKK